MAATRAIQGSLPHHTPQDTGKPTWADKAWAQMDKEEIEDCRKDWKVYCKKFREHFGYVPEFSKPIEL